MGSPRSRMSAADRREIIEQAATELFAERGYRGASMDEIASRSGVSVPVVYDHFSSRLDLHRRLLERHYEELRTLWQENLPGGEPAELRVLRSVDAWFSYVQSHPFAWAMLFRDITGDPEVDAIRRLVATEHRELILPIMWEEPGLEGMASDGSVEIEMAWEVIRSALQGLATWWHGNQHVPRDQVVRMAMTTLWVGFERVMDGEMWEGEGRVAQDDE